MTARSLGDIAAAFTANRKPGRRTEQPVRRHSYDVDDRRARVFRPFGDGTKAGGMRWRDKYFLVAKEYDVAMKEPGKRHPLGGTALRVLEGLLFLPGVDFRTGRLEPAIATIQRLTGYARATVVAALKRLKDHGFLSWVRRTERTGNAPSDGPAVKQATNAYFFDPKALCKRAAARLRQLLGRPAPPPYVAGADTAPTMPADPALAAALARLGTALEGYDASSESGQNPASGV